jgi:hypothetical protein
LEPYKAKKIPDHWKTSPKKNVEAKLIAVSGLRLEKRGTWLIHPRTRALRKYDIGELTLTNETKSEPGVQVNSVLYIGFFETEEGGVIVVGDPVKIGKKEVGTVAGFSDIHCPNHLNIMVKVSKEYAEKFILKTKDTSIAKLECKLHDPIVFGRTS